MEYNNNHKIILQTVIHEGALKEDRGKELVNTLFGHNNTAQILSRINTKLQSLNMIIKCINCEVTGQLYWVFASISQETVKFQLEYSEAELALLNNIYSAIVTSDDGHVSSTWCLNLCSSLNVKLSKDKAQTFLQDMVEKKWLFCKNGQYYMGVRSIGELSQYFKDSHGDKLHTCTLCKEVLFYGEQCKQCNSMTHIYCLNAYTRGKRNLGCPNCNNVSEFNILSLRLDSSDDNSGFAMDDEVEVLTSQTKVASRKKGLKRKH
ncbi:non-structural maintenance of chromosomes element 1 homolog [Odontomachus brunneus]|uniref:non-structural maintenance of chromosomes element 1 homolog n=1 Tax=Odontomachus brunneus TaxID=486640 RepID=UPI0013F282B7|nr:non-structural maintenance of chromosomes element 1 homolog [Odontomachus brunneus]XP_032679146.1 non-structural maintenance of chromosomes element 1 homolog [Odontomachus brunneus]